MYNRRKQSDPLAQLHTVIYRTATNISEFVKIPNAFLRNRKLNAESTINTSLNMGGNTINAELMEAFPDLDDRMTASAYEQAKAKLKPEVFEHILREYNKTMKNPKLIHDKYRLFAIDGSDFTTPYNPKSEFVTNVHNGRPTKGKGSVKPCCQVHVNALYDLMNRTYQDCILQPKTSANERDAALTMIHRADSRKPFIVIMDRGYDGFNMIENCNRAENCYYVIRTKAGAGGIKEISELPDKEIDTWMTFRVTSSGHYYNTNRKEEKLHLVRTIKKHYKQELSKKTKDQRWDFGTFCDVRCRVVKFLISDPDTGKQKWEVLITNLDRFEFPISEMKKLYHLRWDIETSFRELKYDLGAINFHSRKDDFIRMELFAHLIMFNVVSRSIVCVRVPRTGRKYMYAVDFKMACLIVRKYFRPFCRDPVDKMYAELLAYTNPVREGRSDVRNLRAIPAVGFLYRVA